ncbi:MAG: hypothetical protein ABI813_10340 [Bacteroidota bacterium]
MIKWMAAIILFVFIFPATGCATMISHEKKQLTIHKSCSWETANPSQDYGTLPDNRVNTAQQNLQKTNRAQGNTAGQSLLQNAHNLSVFFSTMEILGNSRWHHSYPSHHFG